MLLVSVPLLLSVSLLDDAAEEEAADDSSMSISEEVFPSSATKLFLCSPPFILCSDCVPGRSRTNYSYNERGQCVGLSLQQNRSQDY